MYVVLYLVGAILLAAGLYLVYCVLCRVPNRRVARMAQQYVPRASPAKELEQVFVRPFVKLIAPHIPMTEARQEQRGRLLQRVGMEYTAKEYTARLLVLCAYLALLAGACGIMGLGILSLLVVLIAVLVVYNEHKKPADLAKKRLEAIEYEVPRFIRTFVHGLRANRDILSLLERYAQTKSSLQPEIERLIADMKTSNYEDALQRFDRELDIPAVTNFVSALIAQTRGDDQSATFKTIAESMSVMARENLHRELSKRPGKIKFATIPMVVMVFILYIYVVAMNIISAFSEIM